MLFCEATLDDSYSVDSSPSQETEPGSPSVTTEAPCLEEEEEEGFQTPIKHKEGRSQQDGCRDLKDHRYIIKSTPTPRVRSTHLPTLHRSGHQVSGVNNSVSKYHPNQRVSLRSTPFNKRVEDEMTREEIVLKGIREKT